MSHDRPNVKLYLGVFGVLLVLTVVTVLVSYCHLPPLAAVTVGLAIATVKAGLVVAFFMHLKGERLLIYGLLGLTAFFTAILFIFPFADSVSVSDRMTRAPVIIGEHSPAAGAHH